MNRLWLALLLALATASATGNVDPEDPAITVLAEPEDSMLEKNEFPMDTLPESRQNLNVGTIGATDRIMARTSHKVAPSYFITHNEEITIRGVDYARITAVRVNRVGSSQNGRPTIKAGGLGFNFVTLEFLGNRGEGFEYSIDVHTAVGC
ncbi:hypothetical protein PYW08_009247 [Mythimna loreyi]|uniref:Uncharacterized protein n=1 Tax=Mythimna loreyi TaxID=667449 RepID=A0ACC2Q8M2_9NEOP|nr:hypothetical protein PYW08_009247 [Mythimna loreyi]